MGDVRRWGYCPECGSHEVRYCEVQQNGYKHYQCAVCDQEYFEDVDYSNAVQQNLKAKSEQLTTLQAEKERLEGLLRECEPVIRELDASREFLLAEKERLERDLKHKLAHPRPVKVKHWGGYVELVCQTCEGRLPLNHVFRDHLSYCSDECADKHPTQEPTNGS